MRVFHPHGSKEKLFEMFHKVNGVLITEQKISDDERQLLIDDFIDFASDKLGFNGDRPKVETIKDNEYTQQNKSFASYHPHTQEIKVYDSNRNLADTLRSLAHEMVHHKQNLEGVLHEKSGETGSEHENEANALAGQLMREFGKINPKIFE